MPNNSVGNSILSEGSIFFDKTFYRNFTANLVRVVELPSSSVFTNQRAEIDIQVNHNSPQDGTGNILEFTRNESVEYDNIFFESADGGFKRSTDRKVFVRNKYSKIIVESNGEAWFIYGTAEIVD